MPININHPSVSRLCALLTVGLLAVTAVCHAQVSPPFTTLHTFSGGSDGSQPYAALTQGKDGNFYGSTPYGGAHSTGTIFKITPAGVLTTLYTFSAMQPPGSNFGFNPDGANPFGSLVQGKDGNFYGVTARGGSNGDGTVFKIAPTGVLTTLYTFSAGHTGNADGAWPYGGLALASDGNFYGVCSAGGANGNGSVFKITTSGAFTSLYSFSALNYGTYPYVNSDGATPYASLIQASDGDLYGVCTVGGLYGNGTLFRMTTAGALVFAHSFGGGDGAFPYAGLVQSKDGTLYGTTQQGGSNNSGAVFHVHNGFFSSLYSFSAVNSSATNADGRYPEAPLIQATDGNLYGVCSSGGAEGYGTVFELTPSGTCTPLYTFADIDGAAPYGALTQGKDGNFYGVCYGGGASTFGVVFKLTMAPEILSFSPMNGPVGTAVTLTGAALTGTTAVKFGAIKVTNFTVNSDTSLTFTVPSPGAASAKITVVNAFGAGTSAGAFVMAPVIKSFTPIKGKVGTAVTLTGVNFTGASSVKVGAVAASFTVNSDTSLTLTVPTGAVTAKITVANSYGKGVSTKVFTVTP
jgi:uncharacterized repeat protein (TIGR03803 family)